MNPPLASQKPVRWILEFFFFILFFLFFLTLGSDSLPQLKLRYGFGFTFFLLVAALFGWKILRVPTGRPTLLFLGLFVFYEALRVVWARVSLTSDHLFYGNYLSAPLAWGYLLILFVVSYSLFNSRDGAKRFLYVAAWSGFLLALSAIPPLLQRRVAEYASSDPSRVGFFPPFVYVADWVAEYFAVRSAHVNYAGDVMAIGLFSALGLTLYGFEMFKEAVREGRSRGIDRIEWRLASFFLLPLMISLVTASAILLMFSRGTIACVFLLFFVFLIAAMIRFQSRNELIFVMGIVLICGFFTLWAGRLDKAWWELQTLSRETDTSSRTSFDTNREGAHRALAIYKDYSLWGVGTGGYKEISSQYAREKPPEGHFDFAQYQSMCHYLHLLAEEGVGAYLYFLFLLAYLLETIYRLTRVRSRFQFIAALSLFSVSVMILLHAGFNHLLERVSMSALLMICMGTSLSMLREDFTSK